MDYHTRTKCAEARDGRVVFDPMASFLEWLYGSRINGEWLDITVKKWRPRRSLNQNALFHALCGEIARITGMDAELVKEGIKEQYGAKVKYHDRLVAKPSSMMDTGEMTELIRGAEIELIDAGGDPSLLDN
jgi:hypothetical protein